MINIKGVVIQYGTAIFLGFLCSMNAMCSVWPSYSIRTLRSEDSPLGFPISQNVANLIGSLPMLGSLLSTIFTGYIGESIGRKRTMVLGGLLFTAGWSLLISAGSICQLLVARFVFGLATGISYVIVLLYINEITHISVRGSAVSLPNLLYNCGTTASYVEGWVCSYNTICYINLTFLVLYTVMLSFIHETPTYLLKIGNEKAALKSLNFYRGEPICTAVIPEELSYLKMQVKGSGNYDPDLETAVLSEKEKDATEKAGRTEEELKQKSSLVLLFTVPHNRRAIVNTITFMFLVHSMGMVAVQTNARQFFSAAVPTLSPDLCSVIFSMVIVFSNMLPVLIADSVPRRTLMISNCFIATVCLAAIGVALHFPGTPSWVTLAVMLGYIMVYFVGVLNSVYLQLSESYGPQVKNTAIVIANCSIFIANFLELILFSPAVEYIGLEYTFFAFSAIGAFTTVLAYFCIKETRQMSLKDIQKMYDDGFMYKRVAVVES